MSCESPRKTSKWSRLTRRRSPQPWPKNRPPWFGAAKNASCRMKRRFSKVASRSRWNEFSLQAGCSISDRRNSRIDGSIASCDWNVTWQVFIMQEQLSRITVNPEICHGKPTVRGLRYPVSMVLELLAGGMSNEEILSDYPDLEAEDLR